MASAAGDAPGTGRGVPLLLTDGPERRQRLAATLDRPLLFFGGKGGVGKTTLAVAAALQSAAAGRRTLLVSTDPAHSTSDALGLSLGPTPTAVRPSLWAVEIDPAAEADRYIDEVKANIANSVPPRLATEVERHFDIARVSPGADEAALFDRFTRYMDLAGSAYERVVFDTAPLGHTLRLLTLPEQLQVWIGGLIDRRRKVNVLQRMWERVSSAGRNTDTDDSTDPVLNALEERRDRFERARRAVADPERAGFVFVVVPEWLPVSETERGVATLERHGVPVAAVITNRIVTDRAQGRFAARRREEEAPVLEEIDRRFTQYARLRVPEFEGDLRGIEALGQIGSALCTEGDTATSRDGGAVPRLDR
jgi:arsenite-transporting ATPase